ncbi:hypothetical protein Poli38472_001377 [Pythium oligandrum]|uniref:Glutamine cyclotransferase n=1 Tax=Pythium oligandrum TaxID=41045 RepID=A0A8K1CV66_PYTOL|nr:hypothetical protein Poli38472_001377 [Pythium oligandrum]|eukprot:TMW69221.1 hypothetical protein Poli38472_001377 [Pythium oligandrum]
MPRLLLGVSTLLLGLITLAGLFPAAFSSFWSEALAQRHILASPKTSQHDNVGVKAESPSIEVLAEYPHDPEAFTQGILVATLGKDKFFIESTGLNGKSTIRKVEIATGEVLTKYDLPSTFFGEGVTVGKDGELVMLTWQNKEGFVFDLVEDANALLFEKKRTFAYSTVTGEGWGIDSDGKHLIVSDGSATIMFWDAESMEEVRRVEVTYNGNPIKYLNELEYANGFIYANVWYQPVIVKIDPTTGLIVTVFDCSALIDKVGADVQQGAVLNGIAYDGDDDVFYLTGKLWKSVFKVRLVG